MRVKVIISKRGKGKLTFNYQYALASMLYNRMRIGNKKIAEDLHSNEGSKFYTFSWLQFNRGYSVQGGLDFNEGWAIITSPNQEIIQAICEGLLDAPFFHIRKVKMEVTEIIGLKERHFGEHVEFRTLSPIYLKTLKPTEKGLRDQDLYPDDFLWATHLRENLIRKYEAWHGRKAAKYEFRLLSTGDVRRKRINIGGSYRRCALLSFQVEGDPFLLKFGYEAGFGEKNAMGFGCVEVVGIVVGSQEPRRLSQKK